jgi:hypothetical protein
MLGNVKGALGRSWAALPLLLQLQEQVWREVGRHCSCLYLLLQSEHLLGQDRSVCCHALLARLKLLHQHAGC